MKTVAEQITGEAEAILIDLRALMALSRVERAPERIIWGKPVVDLSGRNRWAALPPEGRTVQGKVHAAYDRFSRHVEVLLADQPKRMLSRFTANDKHLRWAISQGHGNMHSESVLEVQPEVEAALLEQVALVKELYSASEHPIYIPDTNALLFNPDIEHWDSLHPPGFTIYLVPAVLGELDEQKINHRNPDVREKAEKIIRKVKEYRRRGSLLAGVVIAGEVRLRSAAVEPKGKMFDWLDLDNNDDRIIASALVIMRENVHASVVLVTRDINLQNKCDMARLPCIEPPDPLAPPAIQGTAP